MPNETDLAYCAGLIDGEGYLGIIKSRSYNPNRKVRYRVRLSIQMKDQKTIKFVAKILNFRVLQIQPKQTVYPMFNATARESLLQKILESLLPYLQEKKRQAELLLEFIKLQKNWKKHWHGKRGLTDEFFQQYEEYYKKCSHFSCRK